MDTKRLLFLGLSMAIGPLAAGGSAWADNGRCTNPLATRIADSCDPAVPVEGCCANDHVVWCEADGSALCFLDCSDWNLTCGWEPTYGTYSCGPLAVADPGGVFPRDCTWTCSGDCTGRQCGTDGCFGTCGDCPIGQFCSRAGSCGDCEPECAFRECGDDGCGGSCGDCLEGQTCLADGSCCTTSCGGRACGEDGCGGLCGTCGDGQSCGEDGQCHTCTCNQKECGDDGCGAPCGTCPEGEGCDATGLCVVAPGGCAATGQAGCPGCACEACVCAIDSFCCSLGWDESCAAMCSGTCGANCPCVSTCAGRDCGSDGCGGSCGTCADGKTCNANGTCVDCSCVGRSCGDDGCGNSCGTCDEGAVCTGGQCVASGCAVTPDKAGCDGCACEACTCLAHPYCCTHQWDRSCAEYCASSCRQTCACVPHCLGAECGDDGCGGSCGSCDGGKDCFLGTCVTCTPTCEGRTCGDDGCGGTCGTCDTGRMCSAGSCLEPYPASCLGSGEPSAETCLDGPGDAGCCDTQTRVVWCQEGKLYCSRCQAPEGQQATCGWGGTDEPYYRCGSEGEDPSTAHPRACPCTPTCGDRHCGDDGCGGSCGDCTDGTTCQSGECVAPQPDNGEPPPEALPDAASDAAPDAADAAPDATDAPGTDVTADTPGDTSGGGKGGGGGGCSGSGSSGTGTPALLLLTVFLAASLRTSRRRASATCRAGRRAG